VLDAKLGEYIVVARRSGGSWYIGALTNWTARDVTIDLSWLGQGTFDAELFKDGPNADRAAVDYVREQRAVTASDRWTVHLAPGGGFAARLAPATKPRDH
jgi:alpha-glucosidase